MKLTAQQEKFCQCIADGLNQADAYRSAYKVGKSKPETVIQNASRLMADSNVSARVAELRKSLADKSLWTREQSVAALVSETEGDRAADRISAIKALNEMHGYNAPIKSDVTLHMPRTIKLVAMRG